MKKNLAIILAGGSGSRLDEEIPKQFLELAGKPVIAHTIERFDRHAKIDHIFVVTNPRYLDQTAALIKKMGCQNAAKILKGGSTRQESSCIGVTAAGEDYENVLLHDAARPFIDEAFIDRLLDKLESYRAVAPGIESADTLIQIDADNLIKEIPDRNFFRRVQTPQAFKLELIKEAHRLALENNVKNAPDDCSLVLRFRLAEIYAAPGSPENIKITYPRDLRLAEEILASGGPAGGRPH